MDTLHTTLPKSIDVTMVGGTMPGLMFYAGFMQEFSRYQDLARLRSVSGTSAGAAIGALTAVGKAEQAPEILLEQFADDTGVAGVGVFGSKTIQGNLKTVIKEHITPEELEVSDIELKTLHMRIKKGPLMSLTEDMPGREVIWLIQNLVKYAWGKIGSEYGKHEVFDSRKIIAENRDKVIELICGSFQYSPEDASNLVDMLTDGEMGSWHESSGTATILNKDIPEDSNLLVLTRFEKGHESHTAVENQVRDIKTKVSTIIGPSEPLVGNLVSTKVEHMVHNLEVGRRTARMYILGLALESTDEYVETFLPEVERVTLRV